MVDPKTPPRENQGARNNFGMSPDDDVRAANGTYVCTSFLDTACGTDMESLKLKIFIVWAYVRTTHGTLPLHLFFLLKQDFETPPGATRKEGAPQPNSPLSPVSLNMGEAPTRSGVRRMNAVIHHHHTHQ